MPSRTSHLETLALQSGRSGETSDSTTSQFGSHSPRSRVIIIGGGASGVLLACHLLRDPACDLDVAIVEKRPQVGRGVAYVTANPDHLLNVRAANMSAFPDQPDHFWQWLWTRKNREPLEGICNDPYCFVPRIVYGEYLASLIAPLVCDENRPGRLRIVSTECIAVAETRSGVAVTLADGSCYRADFAVLATGHETSASAGGHYDDPWSAAAVEAMAPDAKVLILGTGLTMVDYVLSLVLNGHSGEIVALSRRGLLPQAHRRVQAFPIERTDIPFGAGMAKLLRWLRQRIDEGAVQGIDWRSVIDGLRPFTQEIWQRLPVTARRSFLEHARAWWDVRRHRMAPEIERRIGAALASGGLTVIAAKLCNVEGAGKETVIRFRRRGQSAIETMRVDKIVDCRGVGPVPLKVTNPALRSLLDAGQARFDSLQIGIDVTAESAVVSEAGAPSERLFAVGPLTRGAFWEIVAVPDIRNQCAALARHIIDAAARKSQSGPPSRRLQIGKS